MNDILPILPGVINMTESNLDLNDALEELSDRNSDRWNLSACGVTRYFTQIPALIDTDAYVPSTPRGRVLLVGGLSGSQADVDLALQALKLFADSDNSRIALSAVPCVNPDGLASSDGSSNGSGGNPTAGYPPEGDYYGHETDPESRYLWRFASLQAPDLILEVRAGDSTTWEANAAADEYAATLGASDAGPADSFISAIGTGNPTGLAPIPGLRLTCSSDSLESELAGLWSIPSDSPSAARKELDARRSRTPLEVAKILDGTYGHKLDPVIYTQGVAVSGRLRLKKLDPSGADPVPSILSFVEQHAADLDSIWPGEPGGASLAGVVWADELAEATGDKRFVDVLMNAADRYVASPKGTAPTPANADFHPEDMFYCGTLLGKAFAASGDSKYIDMLAQFMTDTGIQQDDGLCWHGRAGEYYWGRGNGFALMGLNETLTYMPNDHADRPAIMNMYTRLMDGMIANQNQTGLINQVVDNPGSYQEHTGTAMLGISIARGLRNGWIDSSYEAPLNLAWQGINERVDGEGNIVDGCTGTGVQPSMRAVLDREGLFGYDDRTGSMAIWFATEMAQYFQSKS